MKRIGVFLLAKESNAILVAFLCALLPVFNFPTGFIAVIIVGLVTLQKGPKSGLHLLAWVALPSIALLLLHKVGPFDVLLVRCVMIWIFASILRHFQKWRFLLAIMVGIGVAFVFLMQHFIPHLQQWWTTHLTLFIKQYVEQTHEKLPMSPAEFAHKLAPIATALATSLFLVGVLVELMIARFWQKHI